MFNQLKKLLGFQEQKQALPMRQMAQPIAQPQRLSNNPQTVANLTPATEDGYDNVVSHFNPGGEDGYDSVIRAGLNGSAGQLRRNLFLPQMQSYTTQRLYGNEYLPTMKPQQGINGGYVQNGGVPMVNGHIYEDANGQKQLYRL
jgi:hypothetical protein